MRKEAQFLTKLNSPLFVHVYHSFFEQNEHGSWYFCILMEYAEKGDLLSHFIKQAKETNQIVQEAEIWRICKSVTQGLSILHARNIVHKDIKPQNILVMKDLSVKVSIELESHHNCLCIDCGHGHLGVGGELSDTEHVDQQDGNAPVHEPGGAQAPALRLQGGHLGARLPASLHGLSVASLRGDAEGPRRGQP